MQNWRDREFQSVKDIGEILGIGRDAAYSLIHSLPHIKIGKHLRVRTVHLEKYIKDEERRMERPKLKVLHGGKHERTKTYYGTR